VPKLALFGALAVVLVAALIWWQLPRSVQENREQKFVALLADARQANARAQATSDPGAKRTLLDTAEMKLVEAEKIHDDNGELIALKGDVAAALAVLDAVYEVRDFRPIADLTQQVTGTLAVTQSVIGGGSAYLLDAQGGRVLRLPVDGATAPETIFQEGEPAGLVTAGKPLEVAWSEQTQNLIIVDDQRHAFGYFPDRGALPLTVRGVEGWGSLDAITSTGGNLYVLDVKGNQVWRYLPGQGGFDSERTGLLDNVTLTDALELAVGQDVYVLDSELGVRRFSGGTEMPFELSGIDVPLVSPASISVLPGSNRIVLADRGNKRIVVASAEGVFLRQIVSPSFTDLRAVSVDEGTGTMYVLNGDTLLTAAFPP
jgi:DNA-binding beta-propeller fold protein YncE